ncbi:MAG: hypothetical protein GC206_03830 [Alphaproteobacteria bacterium]|nr:hypothetical protein [Alphaproteobacteria bacterium]
MAERNDLEAAAAAGVITTEQVAPLHDFLAARRSAAPAAAPAAEGEETLRFIRNFHDVFLAIGIAILAIGVLALIFSILSEGGGAPGASTLIVGAVAFAIAAGGMWGLGEFFARRRRLFLPAIAICCSFALFCGIAAGMLVGGGVGMDGPMRLGGETWPMRLALFAFTAGAGGGALLFYTRYHLPFAIGLAGGVGVWCLLSLVFLTVPGATGDLLLWIWLFGGVGLFVAGVWFDARDPERKTRYSDNGFWLHLAAAPLILTGVLGLISAMFTPGRALTPGSSWELIARAAQSDQAAVPQAIATLLVVAALGFVSLLINRRALIVSALITTGIAIGVLMEAMNLGGGALLAGTLIALGGLVLILGAGWGSARRALLARVKPDGMWARVFPPETVTE